MASKSYYKLVSALEPIGTLINTEDRFDISRIARFSELQDLLNLFFNASIQNDIPICYILSQIYPGFNCPQINVRHSTNLANSIDEIKYEINRTNFLIQTEFRFFNDLVLSKVRSDLINDTISLPDRFKSHYFFGSLEQCFDYHTSLPLLTPCRVVEIEFIEIKQMIKIDNKFLTCFEETFTAKDFYKQAKKCLLGEVTDSPIFEIVFQGTYRIKRHMLDM